MLRGSKGNKFRDILQLYVKRFLMEVGQDTYKSHSTGHPYGELDLMLMVILGECLKGLACKPWPFIAI